MTPVYSVQTSDYGTKLVNLVPQAFPSTNLLSPQPTMHPYHPTFLPPLSLLPTRNLVDLIPQAFSSIHMLKPQLVMCHYHPYLSTTPPL